MKKIVLVTNIPSPYRIPLFNELHERCQREGYILKIIFLTMGYDRRKWSIEENEFRFDYTTLDSKALSLGEGFYSWSLSLLPALFDEKPDGIIVGGFSAAAVWSNLYSRMLRVPFIPWSGDTIAEASLRGVSGQIRHVLRKWLIGSSSGFIVYGTAAANYLSTFGIDPEDIFMAINTVDTEFVSRESDKAHENRVAEIRRQGFPEKNLCFVGYLEFRKGVQVVLEAIRLLREKNPERLGFHIIGSGAYEPTLKTLVETLGLKDVYFHGFKQKDEIPFYLGISDVLIFPSLHELFGLVPVEAMAAGLPVICSRAAGCAMDLIEDGKNGYLFDPADMNQTANIIDHVFFRMTDEDRKKMGDRARLTIREKFSISKSADGFMAAIRRTVS